MSQLYSVADTLGLNMQVSGDTIWGFEDRMVDVGPFKVKLPITAFSDIITTTETGTFVKFSKSFWMYFTIRKDDKHSMYIFDAEKAGIDEKTANNGAASINATLVRLAPFITAVFTYADAGAWKRVSAKNLDDYIPKQGIQ